MAHFGAILGASRGSAAPRKGRPIGAARDAVFEEDFRPSGRRRGEDDHPSNATLSDIICREIPLSSFSVLRTR